MSSDDKKDLSIVVPVYNAVDFLPRCLDSILAQTIDHTHMETILVDDGSTDGSGALCDEYAKRYPGFFRVVHQANTGGPAAPRNRGIEEAQGRYLFFCDNDDYFGEEAAERMLEHARAWNSDVLLVRLGVTNRVAEVWNLFKGESVPQADLYASGAVDTLGPWKLYRRALLIDHDIRFPEDCSLDDSVFTLNAYLHADTISIAKDYDYYYWTIRDDRGNLSSGGGSDSSTWRNVEARLEGARRMLSLVDSHADRDKALPLHLKIIGHPSFNTMKLIAKGGLEGEYKAARALFAPYLTDALLECMAFEKRVVYTCLRKGSDYECFCAAARSAREGVRRFHYLEGYFTCQKAFDEGEPCGACQQCVECEIERIWAIDASQPENMSEKDAIEISWLEKEEARERMSSHLAGRMALRLSRMPAFQSVLKPVKRRVFGAHDARPKN